MNPGRLIAGRPASPHPGRNARIRGASNEDLRGSLGIVGLWLMGAVATAQPAEPTIGVVHGAFADSSSWYGVITILEKDGYSVIAAPTHCVASRRRRLVRALLAQHRHASGAGRAFLRRHGDQQRGERLGERESACLCPAFAPEAGGNAGDLDSKFPGSFVGPQWPAGAATRGRPRPLCSAGKSTTTLYWTCRRKAARPAVVQRPVMEIAFSGPGTEPAWETILFGSAYVIVRPLTSN